MAVAPSGQRPRVAVAGTRRGNTPSWALLQRGLIERLEAAADEFVARYTRPDGTLVWRDHWPGMDGSDDAYEAFYALPLLYLLGGDDRLLALAHHQWDAVTWQFTEYGQVHREFDAYYDWMHHGEANLFLYFLRIADPGHFRDRQRTLRFARMYTGDDPEAPNYDRALRLIRSPLNGSRGPRLEVSPEDWSTHRDVLRHGPPAFEDMPPVRPDGYSSAAYGHVGTKLDWNDDMAYREILSRFNQRMAKGDVPLNLTATGLVAQAYLTTGEVAYRDVVVEYLDAWMERTRANHGIVPDNIGLNGVIGEYNDGKWWGGYYGWRWPHGSLTVLEPLLVAGSTALLLTGDAGHLDLLRSQVDMLWERRQPHGDRCLLPRRHVDAGWTDFTEPSPHVLAHLWSISGDAQDLERLERLWPRAEVPAVREPAGSDISAWMAFARGQDPAFPERALRAAAARVESRLERIRRDDADLTAAYIHHWIDRNPVLCGTLVQLMLGAPFPLYHGGLLHCRALYFDTARRRPGLPPGVAALVSGITDEGFTLDLVNTDAGRPAELTIQAGAFAEHRVDTVQMDGGATQGVGSPWLDVRLGPGAQLTLTFAVTRHVGDPRHTAPWGVAPVHQIRPRQPDVDPGALRFPDYPAPPE